MTAEFQRTLPRQPVAASYRGPGPIYPIPSTVGFVGHATDHVRRPAYSFGIRRKAFSQDVSPGPKYWIPKGQTSKGGDGCPSYSLSGRHQDLKSSSYPSPDKYNVAPSDNSVYHKAAAYSMGSRTKHHKQEQVPAPNAYSIPTAIGGHCVDKKTNPSYGLQSRPNVGSFSEDLKKTPGPGSYNVPESSVFKTAAPLYSMCGRNQMPGDTTKKPAPGAHDVKIDSVKKSAPKFSFGIRHSQYITPLIIPVEDC